MRPKPILIAIAALAVLALLIRQVTQAVRHTFGGHPGIAQLAHATPAYQNGLTLMEIDNVSPDRNYSFSDKGQEDNGGSSTYTEADTGLWIKLPPNASLPLGCSGEDYNPSRNQIPCRNQMTLTARASDGREMPLRWRTSASHNSNDPTYILASIPAGYPDSVRWADVTLEDHHGDSATWRILNLPPMQHVLAPPVTLQTTFHQGNIQANADAYRGDDSSGNRTGPRILFDVHATITHAAHQWEVGNLTEAREWEPPGYVSPDAGSTFGTSKTGGQIQLDLSRQMIGWNRIEPYIKDNRWVRLGVQLQEFETYDETVTFHNVSVVKVSSGGRFITGLVPQTVTSASGITVTLVDAQNQKNIYGGFVGNETNVRIAYPQTRTLASLPGSPLWRKYKRPFTFSLDFPPPYHGSSSTSSDKDGTYTFRSDKPLPKVMATFPVIIRQRVDLRTVPMTFTLPVGSPTPGASAAPSLRGRGR